MIGHGRITGQYASVQSDRFRARRVHFFHMYSRTIDAHKERGRRAVLTAEERVTTEVRIGVSADLLVAVGPELQSAFSLHFHGYGKPVHSFLPGLTQPATWSKPPPEGLSCLLFGRAEDEKLKGLHAAAEAMTHACANDIVRFAHFEIRGAAAADADELQSTLRKVAGDRVRLAVTPFTSDRLEIQRLLRGSSLVLMPSLEEGFGLTGLEAISEGIPVLLSSTSGLAQAIKKHHEPLAPSHIVDISKGGEHFGGRIARHLLCRFSA